eukprot:308377_1
MPGSKAQRNKRNKNKKHKKVGKKCKQAKKKKKQQNKKYHPHKPIKKTNNHIQSMINITSLDITQIPENTNSDYALFNKNHLNINDKIISIRQKDSDHDTDSDYDTDNEYVQLSKNIKCYDEWIELKSFSNHTGYNDIAIINNNEIIFIKSLDEKKSLKIRRYNARTNKVSEIQKLRIFVELFIDFVTVDHENRKLYVVGKNLNNDENTTIIMIDIDSWKFIDKFEDRKCEIWGRPPIETARKDFSTGVSVNRTICFFGSWWKGVMFGVLNAKKLKFNKFTEFPVLSEVEHISDALYIPSTNKIIFRGTKSISVGCEEAGLYETYNTLWQFCLNSGSCRKIGSLGKKERISMMLTSDSRFVIIVAEDDAGIDIDYNLDTITDYLYDAIYVMDTSKNEYQLNKSTISCPKPGNYHTVIVHDGLENELLVSGYIRNIYKAKTFQQYNDDLIKEISKWYGTEMLHWIERIFQWPVIKTDRAHYCIPIQNIISSVQ